jgi:hypothetical protein
MSCPSTDQADGGALTAGIHPAADAVPPTAQSTAITTTTEPQIRSIESTTITTIAEPAAGSKLDPARRSTPHFKLDIHPLD